MKVSLLMSVAAFALTVTACGGGGEARREVSEPDSLVWEMNRGEEEIVNVSGLAVAVTDDRVALVTEAGDTLHFSYKQALEENRVRGELNVGDKLMVTPSYDVAVADAVVNLSTLMGQWYLKNGAGEWMGFTLQDGGIASSINMETMTYKRWEMGGSQLLLTSVSEGSGSPMELTDTCDITLLTKDSLQLVFHFIEGEQLFKYTRKKGE